MGVWVATVPTVPFFRPFSVSRKLGNQPCLVAGPGEAACGPGPHSRRAARPGSTPLPESTGHLQQAGLRSKIFNLSFSQISPRWQRARLYGPGQAWCGMVGALGGRHSVD